MIRFRSIVGLALLAVLAAGGTVAPLVHRVAHAEETAQTRQRHAQAQHHHHEDSTEHGLEVVPPCPEPLAGHVTCVLCASSSAAIALAPVADAAPEADENPAAHDARVLHERIRAPHGARGPPVA